MLVWKFIINDLEITAMAGSSVPLHLLVESTSSTFAHRSTRMTKKKRKAENCGVTEVVLEKRIEYNCVD